MPREKEQKAYTFSQTLRSQIRGLNIVAVRALIEPGCGIAPRSCWVGLSLSSPLSNKVMASLRRGQVRIAGPCLYAS